ncbi:hypothetical protein EVAR_43919_1 [Eumeta japonica]|uniref:Uncharacterized protein n=1 Tax=Eumeta variegata TaxID=151549 RepID=A0A4C1WMW2_EUMVA|nr:hypothetical protein EVAR_43919_1 [Eumeta japonica]
MSSLEPSTNHPASNGPSPVSIPLQVIGADSDKRTERPHRLVDDRAHPPRKVSDHFPYLKSKRAMDHVSVVEGDGVHVVGGEPTWIGNEGNIVHDGMHVVGGEPTWIGNEGNIVHDGVHVVGGDEVQVVEGDGVHVVDGDGVQVVEGGPVSVAR